MISKKLSTSKTRFSLEIFPPHTPSETKQLIKYLSKENPIKSDFVAITLGAGGSENNNSFELANIIQNDLQIPTMPHLTGLYHSKTEISNILTNLENINIKNVLALRGDYIKNKQPAGDFKYASDLVEFIKQTSDFNITGACYPQKHPEAINLIEDIKHLKEKVDSGVTQLITQILFDNQKFYNFRQQLQDNNINVPIQVGIMPCTNLEQMKKIMKLSSISMPAKFVNAMKRNANNPTAMQKIGINYAIEQINDLLKNDVDGIHLYTMNNIEITQQIGNNTRHLFDVPSNKIKN